MFADVRGECSAEGDGDGVVEDALAKDQGVEHWDDVHLGEDGDGGDGVDGREEGAKHERLDKVEVDEAEPFVDAVDGEAEHDGGDDGAEERVREDAADVLDKVLLLEREAGVEDDGREEHSVEEAAECAWGEELQEKRAGELVLLSDDNVFMCGWEGKKGGRKKGQTAS